jgi:[protein-PII] uridylyltransferase
MQPAPENILAARTLLADGIIQEIAALQLEPHINVPFSIVAVGGYGRCELFPHSDIDVIVLVENESDLEPVKEPLAQFLRDVWDRRLRVSQSVRTIDECTRLNEHNIELNVSLLDLRLIAGDALLFGKLKSALPAFYRKHADRLMSELAAMVRKRHTKFNDTVYHLEPNIKEAPGGIRDIQFLQWLAALAQDKGQIAETLAEIEDSRKFLATVRCFLHQQMNRDSNLLTFELQDRIAAAWADPAPDPAEWMREYYRHARRVYQAALRALEYAELKDAGVVRQFHDWRARLSNSEFTVTHERVLLRNPAVTMSSASGLLQLFTFLARHGLHLSGDAHRRLVSNGPALCQLLRSQHAPWSEWREFFQQKHVAMALRQMQETGLLAAAIPHWGAVECLVVRDFYHRYTVDEHSIVAIEVIDQLADEKTHLPIRFHNLLTEEEHVALLRLALLLHDVGKGTLPGDHVRGSIDVAAEVFDRLSVPPLQREAVLFLIEHHLDLSLVMNGRDLDDPGTARFLTSRIGTQEDLRRLTLLTFADISAVNPTAMTPWRMEQLWRVYLSAQEQLTRELIANRIDKSEASVLGQGATPPLVNFLRGFPTRYLRTHTREEIEHHFELEQNRTPGGVAVEITKDSGVYLLTVIAPDNPGAFASLCGALASCGMNILKAEAASNSHGCILDLIRFADPMRTLELNPAEVSTLQGTVRCVLEGTVQVAELLKRRRTPPRPSSGTKIAPSVRFNNEASDECTLIDFNGEDRPGLLYDLTSSLSAAGCNIELVLVDTEAHKAIDVFYVTREGKKLDEGVQKSLGEALLNAAHHR